MNRRTRITMDYIDRRNRDYNQQYYDDNTIEYSQWRIQSDGRLPLLYSSTFINEKYKKPLETPPWTPLSN